MVAGIAPNRLKVLWSVDVRGLMYAAYGSAAVLAAMLCEGQWCYCAVVAFWCEMERCVRQLACAPATVDAVNRS